MFDKVVIAGVLTLAASASAVAQSFDYIRIGDIDGFGFVTGTVPCGAEPCWPFNNPGVFCDVSGSCSNYVLVNAQNPAQPINVDGLNVLTQGDFIPDLDCNNSSCNYGSTGTHYNSDEFDLRSVAERSGGWPVGGLGFYTEVLGAVDIASEGSGQTDITLSPSGIGWLSGVYSPDDYAAGWPAQEFVFDFSVTGADPTAPVYMNVVFADYDVDSASDTVLLSNGTGWQQVVAIATQGNPQGEDGLVQMATAPVPFSAVFPNWPTSTNGYLKVTFELPTEPFLAFDYAELAITPLVDPQGCCCFFDGTSWVTIEISSTDCDAYQGFYSGDGVPCSSAAPAMGACCLSDGTCMYTAECDCTEVQGGMFYQGVSCSNAPCQPDPEGCCCFLDADSGMWVMQYITATLCDSYGGIYSGDGYQCEGEFSEMGACCVTNHDGEQWCFYTSRCNCDDLLGQFWPDLDCDDDIVECGPVEHGACCYIDLQTGCFLCAEMTREECVNDMPMGSWQGDGSACDNSEVACCRPFGACCVGDTCVWTIEDACIQSEGTWNPSILCADADCPSCPQDINGDGVVDINDVLSVIGAWGPCP